MSTRRALLPLLLTAALLPATACSQGSGTAPSTAATTPASATASASVSATASAAPTEAATTAAPTPSATRSSAPAPSRDSLRNATLQVPDGCRASEPITFSDGTYQSENGTSYLDIAMKDAGDAVVTVNGTQARAVAFACAAENDTAFPAGATLDDLEADLTWSGSTVTASPPSSTPRSARSPTSSTRCTPARRPRRPAPSTRAPSRRSRAKTCRSRGGPRRTCCPR